MKSKRYNLFLGILIVAFCVVCSFVFKDYKKMYDTKKNYKNMKEQCVSETAQNAGRKIHWDKLYKINRDIVAWLEIPDTPIDYPVVKTEDNDYYLSHDIYKNNSTYGAIFIDERLYSEPFESKNLIVYGHNMGHWTDVMFGTLMKYEDKDYLKEHRYVYLYTPSGEKKYKIVSVREASASSDAYRVDFRKENFKNWRDNVIGRSVENTDNIEQILTLSTCTYGNNRLVLHCILEE